MPAGRPACPGEALEPGDPELAEAGELDDDALVERVETEPRLELGMISRHAGSCSAAGGDRAPRRCHVRRLSACRDPRRRRLRPRSAPRARQPRRQPSRRSRLAARRAPRRGRARARNGGRVPIGSCHPLLGDDRRRLGPRAAVSASRRARLARPRFLGQAVAARPQLGGAGSPRRPAQPRRPGRGCVRSSAPGPPSPSAAAATRARSRSAASRSACASCQALSRTTVSCLGPRGARPPRRHDGRRRPGSPRCVPPRGHRTPLWRPRRSLTATARDVPTSASAASTSPASRSTSDRRSRTDSPAPSVTPNSVTIALPSRGTATQPAGRADWRARQAARSGSQAARARRRRAAPVTSRRTAVVEGAATGRRQRLAEPAFARVVGATGRSPARRRRASRAPLRDL